MYADATPRDLAMTGLQIRTPAFLGHTSNRPFEDDDYDSGIGGWWLLPALVAGAGLWIGILSLVLG